MNDFKEISKSIRVSEPKTPGDFMTLKSTLKEKSFSLGTTTLAGIYGLSHLEDYRDNEAIEEIDKIFNDSPNPTSARFAFAYGLASRFWDIYSTWGRDYDEDANAHKELSGKITGWITEGLRQQPNNESFLAASAAIVGRIPSETFLDDDAIKVLEEAAGQKLSIENFPNIKELLSDLHKKIDETIKE